jgi:MFS family permease
MLGALVSGVVLDWMVDPEWGWRFTFIIVGVVAGVLAFVIVWVFLEESPRWLITQGRSAEAEAIVAEIEAEATKHGTDLPTAKWTQLLRPVTTYGEVLQLMINTRRNHMVLGLTLMTSQAFLYNSLAFNYSLLLQKFFQVPDGRISLFTLLFAFGNLGGPLMLGRLFDRVGRRPMIIITYALSGILLAITGLLFWKAEAIGLGVWVWAACWTVTFFFASTAASAAYLTVGEGFASGMRAKAIALSIAFGIGIGGIAAPFFFEWLVQTETRAGILYYCLFAAALMGTAAATAWRLGFPSEKQSLEAVAEPAGREARRTRQRPGL